MYARVVHWDGADAETLRATAAQLRNQVEQHDGPPEGVPSVGMMVLIDPDGGRAMGISLFATEEDRATGHETLEEMSPPGSGFGRRGAVEFYEVGVEARAGARA